MEPRGATHNGHFVRKIVGRDSYHLVASGDLCHKGMALCGVSPPGHWCDPSYAIRNPVCLKCMKISNRPEVAPTR